MNRSHSLVIALLCVATIGSCVRVKIERSQRAPSSEAVADLIDSAGRTVGSARLFAVASGVRVTASVTGLSIGEHGIHLHEVGRCDRPDFMSAGPHVNPSMKRHGLASPNGPHGGDLLNLTAAANVDTARYEFVAERVRLSGDSANVLLDANGTALVIHAERDDQMTDPAGNSQARLVCGVIRMR